MTRSLGIFLFLLMMTATATMPCSMMAQADTCTKDFQISLVPGVGTSGTDAVHHKYHFSVNLFAGVTGGLDGFEAGWFMNINKGGVRGAQFAGFGNVVQGNVKGFQVAGFMNINHGNSQAFNSAGFINVVTGNAEGFQTTGFLNVVGGHRKGFSSAGFANITGSNSVGLEIAGFANIVNGNVKGLQGAGFGNIAAGTVQGSMIAGFINVSNDIEGMQLSGFINVARNVKGIQLGFLNIADSVDGIPVGFLSIVKKGGYRQIEVAGSDVLHLGASFRIGVPAFYNIFSFGARPFADEAVSGFGYGLGTEIALNRIVALQIEGHHTKLERDYHWSDYYNDQLNELRLTFDARIGNRVQLFAGPVLYNQVYRENTSEGITGADLTSYTLHETHWGDDYVSKWWVGARGGLRLRL